MSKRQHLTVYSLWISGEWWLQVKSYIFQILQRFLQQVNNSWVTAKSSKFLFRLGSIVDLCHYRFSEMDHKICYFLGRLTTNSFQLQGGGGFAPWTPSRGSAPWPRWWHSPQTPHYRLALPIQPFPKWNPAYAPQAPAMHASSLSVSNSRLTQHFVALCSLIYCGFCEVNGRNLIQKLHAWIRTLSGVCRLPNRNRNKIYVSRFLFLLRIKSYVDQFLNKYLRIVWILKTC